MSGRILRLVLAAAPLAAASPLLAAPAPPTALPNAPQASPPPALSYAQTSGAQAAGAQTAGAAAKPAAVDPARRAPRRRRAAETSARAGVRSVLREAEARSTEVPRAPEFVNATLHYTWEPGKLFTVQTAVGYLTAVALRPGEHLLSKAAGDTAHWEVGETQQGAAAGTQVLLLLKPLDAGVRTNMILTTDQRTYVLDLVSAAGADHVTLVDWRYPADELRDLQVQRASLTVQALAAQGARAPASPFIAAPGVAASGGQAAGPARLAGPPASAPPGRGGDLAPAALDFNYRIEPQGRRPGWTPEHVFDDGRKTYVKFPADIATKEIPPLFLVGPRGEAELVNYRFQTGYYIVDRLFSSAELRLGTREAQVVRITYRGAPR